MPELTDLCAECGHTYLEHTASRRGEEPSMAGCLHVPGEGRERYCDCWYFVPKVELPPGVTVPQDNEATPLLGGGRHYETLTQDDVVAAPPMTATGASLMAQAIGRGLRQENPWRPYQHAAMNYPVQSSTSDEMLNYAQADVDATIALHRVRQDFSERISRRNRASDFFTDQTHQGADIMFGGQLIGEIMADYAEMIRRETIDELRREMIQSKMKEATTTFSQQIEGRKFRVTDTTPDTVQEPRTNDNNTGELQGK